MGCMEGKVIAAIEKQLELLNKDGVSPADKDAAVNTLYVLLALHTRFG